MWLAGSWMAGMSCVACSVFSAPHARCQWWGGTWFTAGSKSHFHTKTGRRSSSTVTTHIHFYDRGAVPDSIILFLAWVRHNDKWMTLEQTPIDTNTVSGPLSALTSACTAAQLDVGQRIWQMWGKERRWALEVEVKGGGSLSLCHHVGAVAGLRQNI